MLNAARAFSASKPPIWCAIRPSATACSTIDRLAAPASWRAPRLCAWRQASEGFLPALRIARAVPHEVAPRFVTVARRRPAPRFEQRSQLLSSDRAIGVVGARTPTARQQVVNRNARVSVLFQHGVFLFPGSLLIRGRAR